MAVILVLMVISSILMYNLEHEAQPHVFKNAFSGLWWAVETFTTVGYGDVFPITVAGKVMAAVIALLGIGFVAVPTGIISAGFIELTEETRKNSKDQKKFCPYCGHEYEQ
jgi:voltage-gated potassium channel